MLNVELTTVNAIMRIYGTLPAAHRHIFALWERDGQSSTDRHFSTLNYTKFLFCIIALSNCSYARYYYIYSHTTYRVLYIIVLYGYIVRYSDIIVLCYGILCLYAFMRLYAIIEPLRAIILCADTFKRLFAAALMG